MSNYYCVHVRKWLPWPTKTVLKDYCQHCSRLVRQGKVKAA